MDIVTCKKNNKGFSLIELIVVMAVIAIVAAISTYSYNNVTIHRVKTFINECDALLAQCKIETMSGEDTAFRIEKNNNGVIAYLDKNGGSIERIASKSKNFTCHAKIIDASGEKSIEIKAITLSFDRSTGQMQLESYKLENGWNVNGAGSECTKITIANAVGEKSIILIPQTGYHKVQ